VDVRNGATLTITSGRVTNASSYDYDSNINVEEKGALYADSVSFSGVSLSIRDDSHADIKKCSFENEGGISLSSSNNNVITGNTVSNNEGGGIRLSSSSNNTITDNNVSNNGYGIGLSSSSNNTITGNIATNNGYCGIDLGNSSNNYITNNNVSNNDWFGIMFCGFCNNNTIKNNIANKNKELSGIGFLAGYCYGESINNNTIKNNIANNNGCFGIDISGSCNTVTGNNVGNNSFDGILLYNSSNNNIIANNTASNNNNTGIRLYSSSNNNVIANNTISNNNDTGILLDNSSANTIYNNYFNNTENAYDNGNNTWNITKTAGTNIVGDPYLGGNYWSDYAGVDLDGDKLGDTLLPYNCSGRIRNGGDYHPLVKIIKGIDVSHWQGNING
jgi:parallel beta-helix repeat protein